MTDADAGREALCKPVFTAQINLCFSQRPGNPEKETDKIFYFLPVEKKYISLPTEYKSASK
jgi:hypothetical protein